MLMKDTTAAEKRPVIHADVTAEQTIVGNDHIASNCAIVTEMRADHQKIVVADFGRASVCASTMDRAVFANDILIANLDPRFSFWRERNVLRRRANNGAVPDEIVCADRRITFDHNMRLQNCLVANHCFRTNHGKRPDFDIGVDSRTRINKGGGMNLYRSHCRWFLVARVARASRGLVSGSRRNSLSLCGARGARNAPGKVHDRDDAFASTRDACATEINVPPHEKRPLIALPLP